MAQKDNACHNQDDKDRRVNANSRDSIQLKGVVLCQRDRVQNHVEHHNDEHDALDNILSNSIAFFLPQNVVCVVNVRVTTQLLRENHDLKEKDLVRKACDQEQVNWQAHQQQECHAVVVHEHICEEDCSN